jgi:hypothetical protein
VQRRSTATVGAARHTAAVTFINERVQAQLQAGVKLRGAEVLQARQVAVNLLGTGETITRTKIYTAVATAAGVDPNGADSVDVFAAQRDDSVTVDDAPALARLRLRVTCDIVLAELAADGHIIAMEPPSAGLSASYVDVADMAPGGRGTQGPGMVNLRGPAVAESYRLHSRLIDNPAWRPTGLSVSGSELLPLLGRRGQLCWQEALDALRRGLYLAAANMAGAASEAAWYSVGEQLRSHDTALGKALDEDGTARVITRSIEVLRRLKAAQNIDELHAHAAYLRDLRNYGLHPRSTDDPAREHAFTETGCMNVLMTTYRYLHRLQDLVDAATSASSTNP